MYLRSSRLLLAAGLLLAGLIAGCSGKPTAEAPPVPVVRYVLPKGEEVTDYAYFTGRTAAMEEVQVRARVTGYLVEINFVPGSDVKAYDPKDTTMKPLFKIDPRPYQATLDQANGKIKLAEARRKLADADLARAQELAKTPGAISQQDLDKYAAAQEESIAEVIAAKASAESADLNLQFTDIWSPVDGVVSRNLLTIGNLVTADQTLLTTIVSEDPIYAYFDVDERTMLDFQARVRKGEIDSAKRNGRTYPVAIGLANELDNPDPYPHKGTIDFVNTFVSSSTGTLQLRGIFENKRPGKPEDKLPRSLTPGQFVRVRVPIGDAHEAIVVPQAAIVRDQGRTLLLAVNEENVVEARPVNLGAELFGARQVVIPIPVVRTKEGIQAAASNEKGEPSVTLKDRVIVAGLQKIRPGMKVEPREAENLPE